MNPTEIESKIKDKFPKLQTTIMGSEVRVDLSSTRAFTVICDHRIEKIQIMNYYGFDFRATSYKNFNYSAIKRINKYVSHFLEEEVKAEAERVIIKAKKEALIEGPIKFLAEAYGASFIPQEKGQGIYLKFKEHEFLVTEDKRHILIYLTNAWTSNKVPIGTALKFLKEYSAYKLLSGE